VCRRAGRRARLAAPAPAGSLPTIRLSPFALAVSSSCPLVPQVNHAHAEHANQLRNRRPAQSPNRAGVSAGREPDSERGRIKA
jgi:hypothetical protein